MNLERISLKNKMRLLFYPTFIVSIILFVLWMKNMPGENYQGTPLPLTMNQQKQKDIYLNQLNKFVKEPHNFMYEKQLEKTKLFIQSELESYGYQVNILEYGQQRFANLEVVIPQEKENKGTIIIGAHYDSDENAPGADDNGSSVVVLLDLAKRLKNKKTNHKIRIVFFVNEEPPFFKQKDMGSTIYADNLIKTNEKIEAMYALDAIGYFFEEDNTQHYPFLFAPFFPSKGNYIAFVSNLSSRDLVKKSIFEFRKDSHFASEGVSAPTYIQGIDFSDHLSFYLYKIPALMITDTAFYRNLNYHTTKDTIEKLNLGRMSQLTDELEKMFKNLYFQSTPI